MRSGKNNIETFTTQQGASTDHAPEEMAERIKTFDWSGTPLGPINRWPQSLRTAVNILLSSRYQMWMAWGCDLTMIYNDSYRPTLGIKHPHALGRRTDDVWAEIWPDIGPRIEAVMSTGKATYEEGLLLVLERSGFPEETYHTFSYSPLLDDDGRISGMLCVVTEETERLIGERRVETLRDVASALTNANTEDEVLNALQQVLSRKTRDLPFTLTYLFDEAGEARLASCSGIAVEHPLAAKRFEAGSDWPLLARQMFFNPATHPQRLSRTQKLAPLPLGDWNKAPEQAMILPIKQQGQERPAGFFVAATNPYRQFDTAYSGFLDLLTGQIAAGLGNARAYQAERRRAEALAEIDRAKTAFFSNVSHELRTPLTLMLSPVEELLANAPEDPTHDNRELLELVHRNGLRLQKLVNTLLDFSRIEAGRMQAVFEPVDLAQFTADLSANFRSAMERAGLAFVIECQPVPESVYVDLDMWEKIVLNLLSNALKFTFGGTVRVSLRSRGGHVEMEVEDTGTGIPAAELPHVFERFHRVEGALSRTIEGSGIGLALVQELVRFHGGSVSVKSDVGQGSTFTVSIPLGTAHLPSEKIRAAAAVSPTGSRAEVFVEEALRWLSDGPVSAPVVVDNIGHPDVYARGGERILLADDNADMREYVRRLLGERFLVTAVSNGDEALASALANPPDLILSDVMMPGLDGFGLLAEIRKNARTRTIPVILLSARAGEESRVEGLGAGADDYLIKPFTARELLARVGAHLAMRKRREEAEKAVRESQTTLQSFYDSSLFCMGIAELENDDVVAVYCNRATAELFGTEVRTMAGRKWKDLGVPDSVERIWIEQYRRCQEQGSAVRFEFESPHASGPRGLSAVASYLGAGPNGRPQFSFIVEDVTEKRRADELLRRTNQDLLRANADLEQFAYSASHDLQEPLRQVAVYSQLLEKKYASHLDAKALGYLAYCVEGAHRMQMLIRDLLAYSAAGKASMDSAGLVDTNDVIENVCKNLATTIEETGAALTVPQLPKVFGDPVPLTHLFQNLLSNALKYRSERAPEISIGAVQDGCFWRFFVKDNGIGIPDEFRTEVFGIFKRLHGREAYAGTGIGLAICQRVVESLGGQIWVESEEGRGSTFFVTLPIERLP